MQFSPGESPIPAATVVVVRDGASGPEVLLLRRNSRLVFHGGAWVFPGGRIDACDAAAASTGADPCEVARHAAVRETLEEAGLSMQAQSLAPLSRWITPQGIPRRFDTWFFVAPSTPAPVQVDGGEIDAFRWITPQGAMQAHGAGEIELPPPTWVTLLQLRRFESTDAMLQHLEGRTPEFFEPRMRAAAEGGCSLYHGDVAYEGGEIDQPGPRHRLWLRGKGWHYERTTELQR